MANERTPSRWSRRSFLTRWAVALASLASFAAVSGCGVRLEDDAPRIPLLPTRVPGPDEPALGSALTGTWALEDVAASLRAGRSGMPARLRSVHARQATVLSTLLTEGGAPVPSRLAGRAPAGSAAHLRDAERASAAALLRVLPAVSTSHLALLVSLAAQRAAAATLLRATVVTVDRAAAGPPPGDKAVPLLAATRAAVYGFEVVAAQADPRQRPAADEALAALRPRSVALGQVAGDAAGPPPLGYSLPFRVEDGAGAARLARHLLAALSQDTASAAAAAAGDRAAITTLVSWLAEDEVLASRWSVPPAAFPGLVTP